MTLTRRDVLVTIGTVMSGVTMLGQAVDETVSESVTVVRDRTLVPISDDLEAPLQRNDISLSVNTVGTQEGFEYFLDGDVDVLHATRPMLPAKAATIEGDSTKHHMFESIVDGVALLRSTEDWRSTFSTDRLRGFRESNPEGQTWAELVPQDVSSDRSEAGAPTRVTEPSDRTISTIESGTDHHRVAPLPDDTATVTVRGVRADQYSVGHGGLGYYKANGADLMAIGTADDLPSYTPVGRLRYTYVNAEAFATKCVTLFMRYFTTRAWQALSAGIPFADPTTSFRTLSGRRSSVRHRY